MKVFLEIGYTNFKFVNDNSEEIILLPSSTNDLEHFLNHFDFTNDKLYILSNNTQLVNLLSSFKHINNYFLFDHNINHLNLKINPDIDYDELGDDLRFLIYYLNQIENKDIVLMSDGSCLVTIVKQDHLINSISINLGLSTSLEVINNKFGLETNRVFFNQYGTNTNNALALGEYLMFKGILMSTLENFRIKDSLIVLCGNGFNKEWINSFKDTTKLKIEYYPNLVLKTFRKWCLDNFH